MTTYIKDMEEGSLLSLPACSPSYWQDHSFTSMKAYVFGILSCSEDHLKLVIQPHELNTNPCEWILRLSIDTELLLGR